MVLGDRAAIREIFLIFWATDVTCQYLDLDMGFRSDGLVSTLKGIVTDYLDPMVALAYYAVIYNAERLPERLRVLQTISYSKISQIFEISRDL